MASAYERIKEHYMTESEVADLLNIDTKRIRDLRSYHVNGRERFIDHIKPSSRCPLFKVEDVFVYLENQRKHSFGIGKLFPEDEDESQTSTSKDK